MAPDCVGAQVRSLVERMKDGDVLLLENLRFHAEEEANDPEFSKQLAGLADIYVNDAFGTAHRAHASTEGITRFLRPAVAGYLVAKELKFLGGALGNPQRPALAILGGAKVDTKIAVITNLMQNVDTLVTSGALTGSAAGLAALARLLPQGPHFHYRVDCF
jgi:phosphoglycerate kinase